MMDIYKTDGTIETVSDDTDPKTIVGETPKVVRLMDGRFLVSSNEGDPNTHFESVSVTEDFAKIINHPYTGDVIFLTTLPQEFISVSPLSRLSQNV